MICDLRMWPRVDEFHTVDRGTFGEASFAQWMGKIYWRLDVDVLCVSQTSERLLIVHFRLSEDILLRVEKVVSVVVFTAKHHVERVFR